MEQSKDIGSDAVEYMLFGAYPQTRVRDETLLAALNAIAGELPTADDSGAWTSYGYYIFDSNETDFMWYRDIEHAGARYRAVCFAEYRPRMTSEFAGACDSSDQGRNGYHANMIHWFRFEPLRWMVADRHDGRAWLIAEASIDAQAYRAVVWDNHYTDSSIRAWLNTDFLSTAFSASEQARICITRVNNSPEGAGREGYARIDEDTHDRVYLLGLREALCLEGDALFTGATDYARCQGIFVHPRNGNSAWWLRTPDGACDCFASFIGTGVGIAAYAGEDVGTTNGVRPALWVSL